MVCERTFMEIAEVTWRHVPLIPILLTSIQEELILRHCHHPHYGGRYIHGYHRSHRAGLQQRSTLQQTTWKSEMFMLHIYKLQKIWHKYSPSWTDSAMSLLTGEDSYITETPQGQRALNHPLRRRSWPGSEFLCEDGTTNVIRTRNEGSDGTIRGCTHQLPQHTKPIHSKGRASQSWGLLQQSTLPYQATH